MSFILFYLIYDGDISSSSLTSSLQSLTICLKVLRNFSCEWSRSAWCFDTAFVDLEVLVICWWVCSWEWAWSCSWEWWWAPWSSSFMWDPAETKVSSSVITGCRFCDGPWIVVKGSELLPARSSKNSAFLSSEKSPFGELGIHSIVMSRITRTHCRMPSSTASSLSLYPMDTNSSLCSLGNVRKFILLEWLADSWWE